VRQRLGDDTQLSLIETQRRSHLADGRPRAEGIHRAHRRYPRCPIAPVDIRGHLVPTAGIKIHVDVRHLLALGVQEPFEQQLVSDGVH